MLASEIQALGPDILEAAEYARTMSAEDVDEVIEHILVEVNPFVLHKGGTMADLSFNSTIRILSVSLYIKEPVSVLNDFTELPSSCSRSLQTVQIR